MVAYQKEILSVLCFLILLTPSVIATTPHSIAITHYKGGWTIWSPWMPFDSNYTAMDLLAENDDVYVISRLDSSIMLYESFIQGDGEEYNFPIVAGEGYWLWIWDWSDREDYVDHALQWGPNHASPVNYTLYTGWNIVGRCGPYPSYAKSKAINPIDARSFCSFYVKGATEIIISKMIRTGETAHWTSYIYPENYNIFRLNVFEGFYIYVGSKCELKFPGLDATIYEVPTVEFQPVIMPDIPGTIPDPVTIPTPVEDMI